MPVTRHAKRVSAEQAIEPAAEVLRRGGLVVFPTETAYGVGVIATNPAAADRLRTLKAAGDHTAFTLHVPDLEAAHACIDPDDWFAHRAIERLLPGPVTLLVQLTPEHVATQAARLGLKPGEEDAVFTDNKLGLRMPSHLVTRNILHAVDEPVVAALASHVGERLPISAEDIERQLGEQVDLIVDGGKTRFGKASTLVQITHEPTRLHVQSPTIYDKRYVEKLMQWTLLFVCSGNTCRSPMAEAIGRQLLAKKLNLEPDALSKHHVRVISAGTLASVGMPASEEAIKAMREQGLDLTNHRSRPLTPELIDDADVIFGMTQSHVDTVRAYAPHVADKVHLLDEKNDISDPVGMSLKDYQQTARMIEKAIAKRIKQFNPAKRA